MATTPNAIVNYGGNTLSFVVTKEHRQDAVKDPSGTDYLYTRHTFRFQGQLGPNLSPSTTGETAGDTLKRLEHEFLTPRQRFEYSQDGRMILEIQDGDVDAENGPHPKSFNVVMTTQVSMTVEFTIVVCKLGCTVGQRQRKERGWTSHKWSETEDYDQAGYCTLTTRGWLICASDLKKCPDQFRDVMAPRIRRGYQRMSSNYTLSEDGLRMDYTFQDKEFYLGPPSPALKASGRFMIMQLPGKYVTQCSIRLEGAKSTSKQELLLRAAQIVNAKIGTLVPVVQAGTSAAQKSPIVTQATYSEELYENVVEVMFRCNVDHTKLGTTISGPNISMFGTELPGSPSKNQPGVAPPLRGNNEFLVLLAATYDDPCVIEAQLVSGGLDGAELRQSGAGVSGLVGGGSSILTSRNIPPSGGDATAAIRPATPMSYPQAGTNPASINVGPLPVAAPSTSALPYDFYVMSMTYLNDTGYDVLPTAWHSDTSGTDYNSKGFSFNKKVRAHNPTMELICEWSAERTGEPPEIPDPCPDNCNFVLMKNALTLPNIEIAPNGSVTHKIAGRYVWGVVDTTTVPLASPLPPFVMAQIRSNIDAASGRLMAGVQSNDAEIARIDKQIADLQAKKQALADNVLNGTITTSEGVLQSLNQQDAIKKQIADLLKRRASLASQSEQSKKQVNDNLSKKYREGDYYVNQDLIWFRMKTLTPGPFWEDCPCITNTTTESVLIGGPTNTNSLSTSPIPRTSP